MLFNYEVCKLTIKNICKLNKGLKVPNSVYID